MERITSPAEGYCEKYCPDYIMPGCDPEKCVHKNDVAMYEALKSIEGIAPLDRLRELAQADREGRCVVLPCKVGDVVYGFHNGKTILPMVAKWIETNDGWTVAAQYTPMAPKFYRFADFGKTVFLTREEADAALEVQKGAEDER